MRHPLLLLAPLLALSAREIRAEDPRLEVSARIDPAAPAVGASARVEVEIRIPAGFHLWSLDPGPGPQPLRLELLPKERAVLLEPWAGDEPTVHMDRGFGRELKRYEGDPVQLAARVRLESEGELKLLVRGQICTEQVCVPQKVERVLIAGAAKPSSLQPAPSNAPPPGGVGEERGLAAAKRGGLASFFFWAFVAGLAALATPCVFPAIPLTISFFSKYSEVDFARGARLAATYAATMVASFTAFGVLVSIIFGVTGIQRFASHPVFNLFLGLTLIFFALNLLGLFEIRAPDLLVQGANRLEARWGRASGRGGGLGDYLVVAIAAMTATTVFFTCTVAFVGSVLVAAADGEWFWPSVGMLAFSSAFALPFFLLALFPQTARRLRGRAGNWLAATRVTLGFLELAAASKFLSNVDLVLRMGVLTREVVLAFWVPLFALCGLYLLGKLRIGEEPAEGGERHTGVMRMLFATTMFALSLYLTAGLFGGRAYGGWIDGWLPPVEYPGMARAATLVECRSDGPVAGSTMWKTDLAQARAEAAARGRLVFVNYTGYTCTNCRYMEGGIFPRPEVAALLGQMVLAELYTDSGTPQDDANRDDQVRRFGTAALPFYSVERADGTVLATFPSSTNDPEEFRRFLADALEKGKSPAPARVEPPPAALALKSARLSDGQPAQALAPGRWTLLNLWATWCAPCKEELKDFLVKRGQALEARGGRFAVVAVEEPGNAKEALSFIQSVGVQAESALWVAAEGAEAAIDPRFGWGGSLPFTALVSPTGEIAWRREGKLEEAELAAKLDCFAGEGQQMAGLELLAKKCDGATAHP